MSDRILSASAALAEALHEEMARDERIFILGEDLTAHAGIFGQFKGIPEKFPGRILDTPISEACIAGCGVGAALTGMRPIVDFHFADFVTCGMDEFCNQAAKIRYMFGGQVKLPMVVWCPDGAGLRAAAQHSQSLEAWFVHTPGLKVVVPSEPGRRERPHEGLHPRRRPGDVLPAQAAFQQRGAMCRRTRSSSSRSAGRR